MENKDNYSNCEKVANNENNNNNATFFYEEMKQNQNEKLKNYQWKVSKNNQIKSKENNYYMHSNYYNKLKKKKKKKNKKKNNFMEINKKKNNIYSQHDKKKKNNLQYNKNNLPYDSIIKINQEKNKDNCICNISALNNNDKGKSQQYLRNSTNNNYANNFNKYSRVSCCYNKNDKSKYYEDTTPNDNLRLTEELLNDLNRRNQNRDEDSDSQNFLTYVKKIIEEKKEAKKNKNNNDNNNTKEISNVNLEFSNNIETYQTINDNNSLYSDESTKVFVNKKNKIKINMCENPCDMWYGLKTKNGKSIFINSSGNKNKKERKKKSKNIENYFINKKSKYGRWRPNYYMKLNNNDSISVNTVATMHIDGNCKYNDEKENRNIKNNSYTNYNNNNNNNNNFKIYHNKNFVNNIQFDKSNKIDVNNDKLTKQTIKKKNKKNMIWTNKNNNNYVNTNNVHYTSIKNSRNNYFDNKTIIFNNDSKSYDDRNNVDEHNKNFYSNMRLKEHHNNNLSNTYTNKYFLLKECNNNSTNINNGNSNNYYDNNDNNVNTDNNDNYDKDNNSNMNNKENRNSSVINQNNNVINSINIIRNYKNNTNYQSDNVSIYEKNMKNVDNSRSNYYSNYYVSFNKINDVDYHILSNSTKKNNVSNNALLNEGCYTDSNKYNNENNVEHNNNYHDTISSNKIEFYENNKSNIDKISTYKNLTYPNNKNNLNKYSSSITQKSNIHVNINNFLINNEEYDMKYPLHSVTSAYMPSVHSNANAHCTKSVTTDNLNNSYYNYINAKYNNKNLLGRNIKNNKIFVLNNCNFTGNKKCSEDLNKGSDTSYCAKYEKGHITNVTNEVNSENKIHESVFSRNKTDFLKKYNNSFNELMHLNYQNNNSCINRNYSKSYKTNKSNKDENLNNIEGKDKMHFNDYSHLNDQNKKYKNYYYNNLKFDLSYELEEDKKKRKKKKRNIPFSNKSIYKNARERVQSILAVRRGVEQ